jgi:flagellar basal-body rod protein FlgG
MRALGIAATGMAAQQNRVEVISHNIANLSTTAFDPRRAEFTDLMYQQLERPGSLSSDQGTMLPTGIQVGLGVRPVAVSVMHSQGTLQQTGGDLDVAINGKGYLEVEMPDGTSSFTRDGSLERSATGELVTSQGYKVIPQMTIPTDATKVSINGNGEVHAFFTNNPKGQLLGKLTLSTFVNEKGLEAMGDNLYKQTDASGDPQTGDAGTEDRGFLKQGYLEASAVNVVYELTQLIEAQRGYEMNSKVMTATDQMMGTNAQIR